MPNIITPKTLPNIYKITAPPYTLAPIQPHQIDLWIDLQIKCWQKTYTFMNPFYLKSLNKYKEEWVIEKQKILKNPEIYKVFLFLNTELIGFCEAGIPRFLPIQNEQTTLENVSIKGEILRIYILKNYQGKGLGCQLFWPAAQWLQIYDRTPFRVWAFNHNTPAIIFYQKMGGIKEKTSKFEISGQLYDVTSYCFFT